LGTFINCASDKKWRNKLKRWIALSANLLIGTTCFAGGIDYTEMAPANQDGFYVGLGANYNSIYLTQNSWGLGISTIVTSTGVISHGVAQGSGAPFYHTTDTFAPEAQVGYFKHFNNSDLLYGLKFSYQYLGSTATNSNLYIPQLGETTNNSGVTSTLFGYVNGDSIQVTTNHEMMLLAYIGRSFGNTSVYLGAGPSVFNIKSRNFYSIGYASIDGVTIDVTGLVSYDSPSMWIWGGAVQLGMTYFINPTWFIEASYTYAVTGDKTTSHEQAFLNSSSVGSTSYVTFGNLFTKDTLSVNNQSVSVLINKVF
jgi:hypothetical protein